MKRESSGPVLTTLFVDYDNIYMSLKRKNEDAAKRFAKDSATWLQSIASGELISSTSSFAAPAERRIAMNRCYGNPVPRRNTHDNSTDMNSFPFVRHHFLRAGFEVIDCPPLTAQLKNSADIRMVMDIRDILNHDTFFDEFIIMSGDADFTPLMHRLRAHARRTIIFANDQTAQPYTAISDGEIRESKLISLLMAGRAITGESPREIAAQAPAIDVEGARKAILSEVIEFVRTAPQAVPLETLADRAVRVIGRDKTVGTNWGGHGSFRDLLLAALPDDIHLSDTAPYTVFDGTRHISAAGLLAPQIAPPASEPRRREAAPDPMATLAMMGAQIQRNQSNAQKAAPPTTAPPQQQRYAQQMPPPGMAPSPTVPPMPSARQPEPSAPMAPRGAPPPPRATMPLPPDPRREPPRAPSTSTAPPPQASAQPRSADHATKIQQSIARIHEACQVPALAPAEYRVLFDVMAQEISGNGLQGAQTLANIATRAREFGLDIKRDDLRFIYEVISESDPWFEKASSAQLFASRFRNFVVARCRSQGISLSVDELDLIEAWFSAPQPTSRPQNQQPQARTGAPAQGQPAMPPTAPSRPGEAGMSVEEQRRLMEQREAALRSSAASGQSPPINEEEFPRIVRSRFRG